MSAPSSPERPAAEDPRSKGSPPAGPAVAEDVAGRVSGDVVAPAHPDPDAPEDAGSNGEEEGEIDEDSAQGPAGPAGPPLPQEHHAAWGGGGGGGGGGDDDDGWDCQWDANTQAWFFHNRFTGKSQWDNPRVPPSSADQDPAAAAAAPQLPAEQAPVGGYNPAVHGDYDPDAWYAQKYNQPDEPSGAPQVPSLEDGYMATAGFNRFTGQFQHEDAGPGRHTDEAKSRRQMSAFFDVDAAANVDDGRSLKAERASKRITKSELKAFKEKRRARKEEKRRAWLRD
ncbi:WW domain protein [Metarhizium album ARSEF 1941]|uniref:WW domain protein n=1 Tax=Metarhizium album (strain ARSEF 1941) TaxID=1081103 RepID=A0A0B2X180_METAS|nr:WW domain protein [Metarhizium album ARSEF 1941]KHN99629.1 WW domain protein [Metarhizium album ARSEF 1941]